MFTLHYQLLWYKWCYTVCLGNSPALRQKSQPDSMHIYLRETVQDRPDPLLNSTHFFSVVDGTLTHIFWSTGWEVISNRCSHSSMIQSLRFIFIIFQTLHVDVKSWQETRSRNILIKTPQKLTFVRDQIFIFTVVNSGTWRVWSQERRQFLHFGPASQYKTNYFY